MHPAPASVIPALPLPPSPFPSFPRTREPMHPAPSLTPSVIPANAGTQGRWGLPYPCRTALSNRPHPRNSAPKPRHRIPTTAMRRPGTSMQTLSSIPDLSRSYTLRHSRSPLRHSRSPPSRHSRERGNPPARSALSLPPRPPHASFPRTREPIPRPFPLTIPPWPLTSPAHSCYSLSTTHLHNPRLPRTACPAPDAGPRRALPSAVRFCARSVQTAHSYRSIRDTRPPRLSPLPATK